MLKQRRRNKQWPSLWLSVFVVKTLPVNLSANIKTNVIFLCDRDEVFY